MGFGDLVERDGLLQQCNPLPDLPEPGHRPAEAGHDPRGIGVQVMGCADVEQAVENQDGSCADLLC